MTGFITELMNIFKTMPAYVASLFKNHMILFIIASAVFIFIVFFSNKIAIKMRTLFVLASLLLIVFSLISQSWPRIVLIVVVLVALLVCRIFRYILSEIRISRRNRRLEERALDKAAKRRGSWQNKQGYSGARKLIVEPEYIPEEMNRNEIREIIEKEFSNNSANSLTKEVDIVPEAESTAVLNATELVEEESTVILDTDKN